ncbi:MAG TPA: hypothetical protein DCO75_08630 [Fibrobacteres bacterium]|jgi:hypothetical protein|nr:hypothetical protein [Fibrobacterota bacterium]
MDSTIIIGLNKILSVGYFCSFACVNCIMYLISSFYRKKFNQSAPRSGFIIAMILTLLYVMSLFFTGSTHNNVSDPEYIKIAGAFLLIGSATASAWSSILLFFTMKRTRK